MKMKTVIAILLSIFVAASIAVMVMKDQGPAAATPGAAPPPRDPSPADATRPRQVVAYYFHTTQRCPTCHKIENFTREAIESGFPELLREGRLVFQVLNVEEAPNAHFVQDYQLHTKSVIIVELKNGQPVRWKNLDQVWRLVGDKDAFLQYIREETRVYLEGR